MTGLEFVLEKRVGSPVARGATGTLYLPSAIERMPGRWWLGLNEGAFAACADARGVVLLCESGSELLDFWLPTEEVRELLPRLSSGKNHERQFNVEFRGGRYWLHVPGIEPIEITARRGDPSWLAGTAAVASARSSALRRIVAAGGPVALPADFAQEHDHYARGTARR